MCILIDVVFEVSVETDEEPARDITVIANQSVYAATTVGAIATDCETTT